MARELTYCTAEVAALTRLSPHLRRLVLRNVPSSWASAGVADEAVLLVFPGTDGQVLLPPDVDDGDPYRLSRWYTVRRFDPEHRELTVDLVVHDVGASARWARQAREGQPIGMSDPRHWYAPPADAGWQLLLGDLTALPAISRVLEEHDGRHPVRAYVQVPDPADAVPVDLPAAASLEWVVDADPQAMLRRLRALRLPPGAGYVFVAGETGVTRDVRRHLRHQLGLANGAYTVTGYWRPRSEEWLARYEIAAAELGLEALYEQMETAGADVEALTDELDRRLASAGL